MLTQSAARPVTIRLSAAALVSLTQARADGKELPEFCGEVLETLGNLLRGYHQEWERIVACDTDVPEDVPATIERLEMLIGIGATLANFVDQEHLRLEKAIDRLNQLTRLIEAPIEVEVPVVWTPDQGF